jgi:hypothetical protein
MRRRGPPDAPDLGGHLQTFDGRVRSATGLSADYQALADEILGRFVDRSQQAAPA